MFPFFIPFNSGGGGPEPSWKFFVVLLLAIPGYAFVFALVIHLSGIKLDDILFAWYGIPAMVAAIVTYVGLVLVTAMSVD